MVAGLGRVDAELKAISFDQVVFPHLLLVGYGLAEDRLRYHELATVLSTELWDLVFALDLVVVDPLV